MNDMADRGVASKEAVLKALVGEISIPPHLDARARERGASLARWLNREASAIKHLDPAISYQGSFRLGTAIRPVGDKDAYDVDMVIKLRRLVAGIYSQAELKALLGEEIRAYAKAHSMNSLPSESRRCWVLDYADEALFHIDILPARPAEREMNTALLARGAAGLIRPDLVTHAIGITDQKHPDYDARWGEWPISNPGGYARWFADRQRTVLEEKRLQLRMRGDLYASIEELPLHKVRTPLQDSIMLLKRDRDAIFDGAEHKPISAIITTLAARAYGGEKSITEALRSILPRMEGLIEERGNERWVANPAYPLENFADKWAEQPDGYKKQKNFYSWIRGANRRFGEYLNGSSFDVVPPGLRNSMTETTMGKVLPFVVASPSVLRPAAEPIHQEVVKVQSEGRSTRPWLAE